MKDKPVAIFLTACLLILLSACGGSSGEAVAEPDAVEEVAESSEWDAMEWDLGVWQ